MDKDNIDDNAFGGNIEEVTGKKSKVSPLNKTGKTVTPSSLVRENIKIKKAMAVMGHDLHTARNHIELLQKLINELKQENKHRIKEIDVLRQTVLRQANAIDLIRTEQGNSKKRK